VLVCFQRKILNPSCCQRHYTIGFESPNHRYFPPSTARHCTPQIWLPLCPPSKSLLSSPPPTPPLLPLGWTGAPHPLPLRPPPQIPTSSNDGRPHGLTPSSDPLPTLTDRSRLHHLVAAAFALPRPDPRHGGLLFLPYTSRIPSPRDEAATTKSFAEPPCARFATHQYWLNIRQGHPRWVPITASSRSVVDLAVNPWLPLPVRIPRIPYLFDSSPWLLVGVPCCSLGPSRLCFVCLEGVR